MHVQHILHKINAHAIKLNLKLMHHSKAGSWFWPKMQFPSMRMK